MTMLLSTLVALLAILLAVLWAAHYRVSSAPSWESVEHWLLVGSYAAPAAILTAGAVAGAGLAWWVS